MKYELWQNIASRLRKTFYSTSQIGCKEALPSNTIFSADTDIDIPSLDLVSHAFSSRKSESDEPVYIDAYNSTDSLTAKQLKENVRKLICGLQTLGLKPGDSVCVHSFNHIWYPVLYLGIIGAGGVFVGSNPAYTARELTRVLTVTKAKFILVQPELSQTLPDVAAACKIPQSRILMIDLDSPDAHDSPTSLHALLQHGEADWIKFDNEETAKRTTAALLWTSGTSGVPKAAAMSHYGLVAQSVISEWHGRRVPYKVRRLLPLPLFHSFILPFNISPLREGHQTYIMKRFNRDDYVDFVKQFQINTIPVVPPIALAVFGQIRPNDSSLTSLREIVCAGAPLGGEVQTNLARSLHEDARFVQLWGMTETGWLAAYTYPERGEFGSVGRLVPNTKVKAIDRNGAEVRGSGGNQLGELYIQGPGTMSYYINEGGSTENDFEDGWFRTGDIGYQKQGQWYIVDRAKDLIKVRGWSVSPAEIEACLLEHPGIKDAAVIGIKTKDGTEELPRAFIVKAKDVEPITEQMVKEHVQKHLAKFKALDGGVQFVDTIPRTVSGKILRRVMRDMAREEI